ncbi:Omp28-related outer membrane protein [Flavobacterium sp. MFBS3-15]|uniref:Omp28-related outer membrane protein n=1 Tax=Flavobacterium sp. MFBS3-15 TaxID=2989816 RepID=UPI002235839A|nr:Omp28-related outer membrane protein [Flavobacterium sp. MFBS3-15]MCW4469334.1 Omp28-related outer membrane protein [Flavobacterium sp. MFBS3-15]
MKKNFILLLLTVVALSGCSTDYELLKSIDGVILTADSSIKALGETVTFTVKDNTGADLTGEAAIYVDGEQIEGNTLTSDQVGSFEVTAEYIGVESLPLEVRFHDGSETNFVKRVLIEDYTGTWCGYCPRVAFGIEQAKSQSDKIVAVAIHRPSSNPSSPVYDPYNYDTTELENTLGAEGYPKGFLNRKTQWNFPEPENLAQVIGLTQGNNPKMGLAMNTAVNGNTINLDVNVKFAGDFSNLKLVVYVLENGLVYEQHNYTTYYDGVDVLEDFDHNHVLRAVLTPLLGEAISSNETVLNNVFTRSFSVPVPANVANAANIEFVAFVVDAQGNAINVRQAGLNATQEFEEM